MHIVDYIRQETGQVYATAQYPTPGAPCMPRIGEGVIMANSEGTEFTYRVTDIITTLKAGSISLHVRVMLTFLATPPTPNFPFPPGVIG